MKLSQNMQTIYQVINSCKRVSERIESLESKGFIVDEKPMGSGGVGQVQQMADHYRVQISAGYGRNNYAKVVLLNK